MGWLKALASLIPAAGVAACTAFGAESEVVRSQHVAAQLVSEVNAVRAGASFWVGIRLEHDPHWHTYWINPADSGLETMISWELPEGFSAGEIQWPYPERLEMGPLVTFGFEREVLLMVEITPPDDLEPGAEAVLTAQVEWLECKEVCLPGSAVLTLTLPVTEDAAPVNEEWSSRFQAARAEWPVRDAGWTFSATRSDRGYIIRANPPDALADHTIEEAVFFILDPELVEYPPPQNWRREGAGYAFDLVRDESFGHRAEQLRGVLVSASGWRGPGTEKALHVEAPVGEGRAAASDAQGMNFALALLFAFLGGVALNLMPCVFPVISMKIMGFVQQAEESHAQVLKHGLLFGLGILVSFWVLAGLLIALRAGGEQLGWGFHLQSPAFLFSISLLLFLLALNLFGVFEVGASWMGLGQKAGTSSGATGSFFSGAVATLIATPCTAPFMGAALGYALTLSALEAMIIFSLLGVGMAAPYVLLSAFPDWLSRIPKPGPWMESFKQGLGWLFLLFVMYLLKVLEAVGGGGAVLLFVYAACAVGIGAWILGRWGALHRGERVRFAGRAVALLFMLGGLGFGVAGLRWVAPASTGTAEGRPGGMPWQEFSPERYDELRASGTPFFINFTAAWCTICQVNERVTFSSSRVIEAFEQRGIVPLKADWTQRDDTIEGVLAGYGRSSVPFYVLYGSDPEARPKILPEMLRPGIVLSAVESL